MIDTSVLVKHHELGVEEYGENEERGQRQDGALNAHVAATVFSGVIQLQTRHLFVLVENFYLAAEFRSQILALAAISLHMLGGVRDDILASTH